MLSAPPLVHIGYHKTATTWFQQRFYPSVADASVVPRATIRELFIEPRALDFDAGLVHRTLPRGRRRPILCDEELSGNIHSGGLHGCLSKELAHRLRAVLPDARIVVVIRNQVEMTASIYRQYVRIGGTYGVDRYLWHESIRPHRSPLFDLGHLDYATLIAEYARLFGPERVTVLLFEQFVADQRRFLDDLSRRLQLDVDLDSVDRRPIQVGYGDRTLGIARLANAFTRDRTPFKYYLVHVPGWHRWSRRLATLASRRSSHRRPAAELLGERNVAAIQARVADSNRWLATEYGLPLDRYGYPLPRSEQTAAAPSGHPQ